MKPRKYFWDPPGQEPALKADINRHRAKKAELERQIEAFEKTQGAPTSTWRNFRCIVEQNLAELGSRIGRKPPRLK